MARQTLTPVAITGKWPTAPVALPMTAADSTNKEQVPCTGREIIIARNTNAASTARTITITSVSNPADNRTGDITAYSIPAGTQVMIGPLAPEGWRQNANGYTYIEASNAEVVWSVIQIPG